MTTPLSAIEIRILGSLMEKGLATPDYYPLSLNALTNACNQKSNREPVVAYGESEVQTALDALEHKNLVNPSRVGRVPKYEELFARKHDLVPKEAAVLCVLMLRGPQTVGEIRGRTGRLCVFDTLDAVDKTLSTLSEWGLVQRQTRLPGQKEARYIHLLGGAQANPQPEQTDPPVADTPPMAESIQQLEAEVAQLSAEIDTLRQDFDAFKAQFE